MNFFKDINPTGAIGDFITVYRRAGRMRWRFMALALATSFALLYPLIQESHRIPQRPPSITYITSWHAGRSDAEIMKSNIENQRIQDGWNAELARREAEVRGIYRRIGKASGMDVDSIDRQAQAERDAAAAKAKLEGEAIIRRRENARQ